MSVDSTREVLAPVAIEHGHDVCALKLWCGIGHHQLPAFRCREPAVNGYFAARGAVLHRIAKQISENERELSPIGKNLYSGLHIIGKRDSTAFGLSLNAPP